MEGVFKISLFSAFMLFIAAFIILVLSVSLFCFEVYLDNALKNVKEKHKHYLKFIRLNLVSILISLLSFFIVFIVFLLSLLFEDKSTTVKVGIYETITIAILSGVLYMIYLSYPVRKFLMTIEIKVIEPINQKIDLLVYKKKEVSATSIGNRAYDDTITGRLNDLTKEEISLFTSWSDSNVLVFTALGLFMTAYGVIGTPLVIYILIFTSIIITKIRLNHLKEDNKEK